MIRWYFVALLRFYAIYFLLISRFILLKTGKIGYFCRFYAKKDNISYFCCNFAADITLLHNNFKIKTRNYGKKTLALLCLSLDEHRSSVCPDWRIWNRNICGWQRTDYWCLCFNFWGGQPLRVQSQMLTVTLNWTFLMELNSCLVTCEWKVRQCLPLPTWRWCFIQKHSCRR